MYYLTQAGVKLLEGSRSPGPLSRKAMAILRQTPRAKKLGGVAPDKSLEHADDDSMIRTQARPHDPSMRLKNFAPEVAAEVELDRDTDIPPENKRDWDQRAKHAVRGINRAKTRAVGTTATDHVRGKIQALSMMSQDQPRVRSAIRKAITSRRIAAQARNFERS
tara:strand:+ start:28 stop:519 length:492 start_codon:yes stop_codon:yes gene_type:complete